MPEINDVQIGETIAVEWGNAIRDRTIQRYANAAEREALHPNPTEGDLSYLEDTNSIEVFNGFAWVAGIPNGAVTTAKIADEAVVTAKIAPGAIVASRIADGVVSEAKIANQAVTQGKIAPEAVTFSRIAGNAISSGFVRMAGTSGSPSLSTSDAALLSTSINIPSIWNTWSVVVTATGRYQITGSVERVRLYLRVPGTQGDSPFFDYDFTPDGNSMPCALTFHRSGRTATGSQAFELRGSKTGSGSVILVATTLSVIALRES